MTDPTPTQITPPPAERLYFRTWTEADLGLAIELWGDPLVTERIGGPFTEQMVRDRLARENSSLEEYGVQYWPIFMRSTGDHLGCCGLRPYRPEESIFELGFHLRPEYWGQGYASEAASAVIDHSFRTLCATSLFAGHHPQNLTSRRLLERLGFRQTHTEFYPPTGLDHPSYRLSAREWLARPR